MEVEFPPTERQEEAIEEFMNCSQSHLTNGTCAYGILALLGAAQVNWTEFSITGIFYLIVIFGGLITNILVIVVVTRDRMMGSSRGSSIIVQYPLNSNSSNPMVMRRRTCRYSALADTLIFLCISDLLVVIVCIPVRFARWFTFTWIFGELLCKAVFYLQYWFDMCSILTLMFVTYQRYYVATHRIAIYRIWNARRRRACLLLLVLIAAALASPVLIGQKHRAVGVDKSHYWCLTQFSSDRQLLLFEIYIFFILIVGPLFTMVTAYACLLRKVSGSLLRTHSTNSSQRQSSAQATSGTLLEQRSVEVRQRNRLHQYRRLYQLSALSVFVYTLCWTPWQLDRLLSAAGYVEEYHVGFIRYMRMATTLLSYANSCLNPVVYCLLSSQFRKSVMGALRRTDVRRRVGLKKSLFIISV